MVQESAKEKTINVWDYKPWWCQPWSILLTGIAVISGSWLLLHKVWLTAIFSLPVIAWMGYFILLYPKLVQRSITLSQSELEQ